MIRVLLLGRGRMGRLVESLAPEYGASVAGIITRSGDSAPIASFAGKVDVAIDFTLADAALPNLEACTAAGISMVIGTTGWHEREAAAKALVERSNIAVLAASNFSIGLHVFRRAVASASVGFAVDPGVGAWIHEAHHDQKKDAPSGTAVTLRKTMTEAGYDRPVDVSSTRAGSIPGTHTVGFDAPSETVTLTHTVRDRAVFARGALECARWLVGRRGWFTMDDFVDGRTLHPEP